jgi:CheY-like chemotaxis protein
MLEMAATSSSARVSGLQAEVHVLGLQGVSVVIIDDQETARVALDEMIRGIDPNISTSLFSGGADALAWLERHEPDLVITDYRMPDMTGAQFTREFRKNRRLQHVPVVVVTAADERSVRYAALEAGAVDFLAKPIDPLEVRTRCRNLLLLAHQHRLVRDYSAAQDCELHRLQALLNSLTGSLKRDLPREQGEMVAVAYDKLFAITSCVAGVQELVTAAQRNIADLEAQLSKPLRGGGD